MGQHNKILVTEDGTVDLSSYKWDDHLFSDILTRDNPINTDQAMTISRSLREEIVNMELHTLTIPLLEKLIEAKLLEYGFTKPVKLASSMFKKDTLALSENARTVLEMDDVITRDKNRSSVEEWDGGHIVGSQQLGRI